MKLRIRGNSVRLRLTQGDVQKLGEAGLVEEAVEFVPNHLVYMIHASKEAKEIEASFRNGWITISVPEKQVRHWADGDETGMSGTFRGISILIEKDWACEHPNSEDDDTFPRPA